LLQLFNSLGRKLEVFEPIRAGEVRMYTCGPTVWNYAHIGNFRTFTFEDVLRRYLIFKGYKVTQIMNITDVEDKILKGMKQFHMTRAELVSFYEAAFMQDLESLNIQKAEGYPRATEHVSEMVALIEALLRKEYAYKSDDGSIYYDVSKFSRYGALSGIRPGELKSGARVKQDSYDKEQANDFALWKAWDPDDGEVYWQTVLGKGRPGWHIECSAMSMKYLGESFDIHTGGIDNKFPHHENEIAQSEAATGKQFVRFWLHSEFLNVRGEEMHKSSGNIVTLRELVERGWNPRALRLFLLGAHYREGLDLADDSLEQAAKNIERADEFVRRLKSRVYESGSDLGESSSVSFLVEFEEAMDDDLNVPKALAAFYGFQRTINSAIDSGRLSSRGRDATLEALKKVDSIFGIMQFKDEALPAEFVDLITDLIRQRESARAKGDYERADELRNELKKRGVVVQDAPGGTTWKTVHTDPVL
jgi:cysteinyl-tRNA synthetase